MANIVSIVRVCLAVLVVVLLSISSPVVYWIAFFLTLLVIAMDALDGHIARKRDEETKLGAVIDILGDRVVEVLYLTTFAFYHWIPLFVPLVVFSRGIITDGLRSIALRHGFTPFGDQTMMQSGLGRFLVASRISRGGYAILKAAAFSLVIVSRIPAVTGTGSSGWFLVGFIPAAAMVCVYGTVILCLIRGIPVILESFRFFKNA